MDRSETEIEMVRRHIREGEVTIARQHLNVVRLSEKKLPTKSALELLRLFERIQSEHNRHLGRLKIPD